MNTYPIEKYRFIVLPEQRKVIAITRYAGKPVRGIAICSENDEFDIELGKRLAAARANFKVAKKRQARAEQKLAAYESVIAAVEKEYHALEEYLYEADTRFEEACDELIDTLTEVEVFAK